MNRKDGTIRIRKARYTRIKIPLDEIDTARYRRSHSTSAYVAALCFGAIGMTVGLYYLGVAIGR